MNCVDDFITKYEQVEYWWEPLDRPIFAVFAAYPQHDDVREVYAKVALVNRVYRANVQTGGEDAEWHIAERFVEQKDRIASALNILERCERFSRDTLPVVMDGHELLVRAVGSF